jgi:hypothetical protein
METRPALLPALQPAGSIWFALVAVSFVALALLAGGAACRAESLASVDFNLRIAGTTTEIAPWTAYDMTASGK